MPIHCHQRDSCNLQWHTSTYSLLWSFAWERLGSEWTGSDAHSWQWHPGSNWTPTSFIFCQGMGQSFAQGASACEPLLVCVVKADVVEDLAGIRVGWSWMHKASSQKTVPLVQTMLRTGSQKSHRYAASSAVGNVSLLSTTLVSKTAGDKHPLLVSSLVWQGDVCCLLALVASVLFFVPCQYHNPLFICSFFFLWRGRNCTRLGPYNCVSCENLSEKDPKGPNMANPFTTKQTENGKQPQRPANPPARFAFHRKSNSKTTKERGRAQQKHTHTRIAMKILLLVNSIESQKHANELPCGRSAVKRSATADKIQWVNSSQIHQLCITVARHWKNWSPRDHHPFITLRTVNASGSDAQALWNILLQEKDNQSPP